MGLCFQLSRYLGYVWGALLCYKERKWNTYAGITIINACMNNIGFDAHRESKDHFYYLEV